MVAALLLGCATPPPDVLLFTFDTTRADALGAYGASPSPSPTVDALAARGIVWEEATTPAPLTLPAHTAIHTGRYPGPMGLRRNGVEAVPADALTPAEHLKGAGYATGAFVAAVVLDASFGLDQGFDVYEDGFDITGEEAELGLISRWSAREVGDRAQAWLLAHAGSEAPLFLWVHFYDTHQPIPAQPDLHGPFASPYAHALAAMDDQLGKLLEEHRALGRPTPLVAVAGDHGESQGEHGEATHGFFAYRSTMRVPLLLTGPGISPRRERGVVSLVDLAPTLAAAAGVPLAGTDGRDQRGSILDTPAFGEAWTARDTFGLAPLRVIQDDTYRYIDAPRPELYRWREDPLEARNLLDAEPAVAADRAGRMDLAPLTPLEAPAGGTSPLPAQLASLGYLSGPAPTVDLADPKDFPALNEEVERLVAAARRRPPLDGVALLEAFLRDRREVPYVRLAVARGYRAHGALDRAREALSPLLAAAPGDPPLVTLVAQLAMEGKRYPEAESLARSVVERAPQHVPAFAILAETLRQEGKAAEAEVVVDRGLLVSPDTTSLLLVKGVLALDAGRVEAAVAPLQRVLAADPRHRDALLLLALALGQSGKPEEALPLLRTREAVYGPTPESTAALARALYGVGRLEEATPRLRELSAAAPDTLDWHLLLADSLLRTGHEGEGREHLEQGRKIAPGDPSVVELTSLYAARR